MHKIKVIATAILLGVFLASPAFADVTFSWRFDVPHQRWEKRYDVYSTREDLREARRKLRYDLARGASYRTIQRDRERIREIEASLAEERMYNNQGWYWHDNGWHKGWNR